MVAVDILEVPVSRNNHNYLLLLFTILPNGLISHHFVIRKLLLSQMPLSSYGVILAFQMFYILIRAGTLKAHCSIKWSKLSIFTKAEQQHVTPKVMERWNVLIAHC